MYAASPGLDGSGGALRPGLRAGADHPAGDRKHRIRLRLRVYLILRPGSLTRDDPGHGPSRGAVRYPELSDGPPIREDPLRTSGVQARLATEWVLRIDIDRAHSLTEAIRIAYRIG